VEHQGVCRPSQPPRVRPLSVQLPFS
jgi:hypothetical protein